jgi:pimeloyl-ACP methyl ester carboxylesterase
MYQQKDIYIKKIKTHFLESENDKKDTVIMLHGILANHRMFNPLIKRLSPFFTIYALDEPGFGESESLLHNSIPEYGKWLYNFIQEQKIQKPILFGMSLGGLLSLYFAGTYPDIPSKVIVQAPPISTASIYPTQLKFLSTVKQVFTSDQIKALSEKLLRNRTIAKLFYQLYKMSSKENDRICNHLGEEIVTHLGQHIDTYALTELLSYLSDFSIEGQIKKIKVPLRVIIGKDDLTVIPQSLYKIKLLNPKAEIIIHKEGDHAMAITKSEIIAQDILEFIKKTSTPYSLGKRIGNFLQNIKKLVS